MNDTKLIFLKLKNNIVLPYGRRVTISDYEQVYIKLIFHFISFQIKNI